MKRVLRYAVMLPGVLYLWALLPVSFRPQYTGSPLRKPVPTVNVDVTEARAAGVATPLLTATAVPGSQKLSNNRLKEACEPPALLKPIVRPAQQVVVRYMVNGRVVAEKRLPCSKYV
ncbi:MAG: hypothetical protein M3Q30_08705 [Actinomycetota bacterium]|nr:hypothetical protein [Actinomycetota bacterium]